MKAKIALLLQYAADAMSSDPAIQAARKEGLEKIAAAKAEAKELRKRCAEQRQEVRNLHKQERAALEAKQKSEYALLIEEQQLAQTAANSVISSKKEEMLENLRQVRKDQQEKIAKADAYIETEVMSPAAA
jgi:hypothetical protein